MKRYSSIKTLSISLFLSLYFTFTYAQKPLFITGGNSVSGALCSEGKVYAWGLNSQGFYAKKTKGTLGTGDTSSQNISTPTLVHFPQGVFISQLATISGAYFLAIDSTGKVWGWGENTVGQAGFGDTFVLQPHPVLVLKGSPVDLTGFRDSTNGQLCRIKKLYAGNATSLALTNDGRLLSWGCNGMGCNPYGNGLLGNGTTLNTPYPTFVLDGSTNKPLANVKDMSIGDHLALALVSTDGEFGRVYSWGTGYGRSLGRNALGTGNNGFENVYSNIALPVRFQTVKEGPSGDGYLGNIKSITTADLAGFALDNDGFVWAWGNGGYGALTGQGMPSDHSDPKRVLSEFREKQAPFDSAYLKARAINAGQAFASAITLEGKPVAWGNNACSRNVDGPTASPNYNCGGSLGNNTINENSWWPSFVVHGTGQVHNDVVAIVNGNLWGYYVRSDNSIWTWGDNIVGQLGIGNYVTQKVAVPLIFSNCSFPDPQPNASIHANDTALCLGSSKPLTLQSGFTPSSALIERYEFAWFKQTSNSTPTVDTSLISKGNGLSYASLSIHQPGTYWLRITYKGTRIPNDGYTPSFDRIVIDTLPSAKCLSTDLNRSAEMTDAFSIYPNPSTESFWVDTKEPVQLRVCDASGKEIESKKIETLTQIGEKWQKGMYLITIQGSKSVKTLKLLKLIGE